MCEDFPGQRSQLWKGNKNNSPALFVVKGMCGLLDLPALIPLPTAETAQQHEGLYIFGEKGLGSKPIFQFKCGRFPHGGWRSPNVISPNIDKGSKEDISGDTQLQWKEPIMFPTSQNLGPWVCSCLTDTLSLKKQSNHGPPSSCELMQPVTLWLTAAVLLAVFTHVVDPRLHNIAFHRLPSLSAVLSNQDVPRSSYYCNSSSRVERLCHVANALFLTSVPICQNLLRCSWSTDGSKIAAGSADRWEATTRTH